MFSSAFAKSAMRGSREGEPSSKATTTASEGKRLASSADRNRLAPVLSGDAADVDGGGIGNGGSGGGGGGSGIVSPFSAAAASSKRKKRRKVWKKRSPWLSAPMILGSEVASNIA